MIIAFYPGAGGNRYLRMTRGQEYKKHGRSYDNLIPGQLPVNRYIYPDVEYSDTDDIILTHCVNSTLIKRTWPNHSITIIKSDLQSPLRRQWILHGHQMYREKVQHAGIDKIDLYNAIKDVSWPAVEYEQDILLLPCHIRREFDDAYLRETHSPINPVTDVCGIIKKEYTELIESACAQIQWHKDYYNSYPLDLDFCDTVVDINNNTEFSHYMQQELSLYSSEVFDRCWNETYGR